MHVRTSKRPPVELIARQPGTSALRSTELEWEDALHTLAKPKSGRACGSDAIPSELIAAGGEGYRRALGALCAKMSGEGAPILWKGGDMAAVLRKPGPLTPSNVRGVLCSSCPGKMYASVLRAAAVPWPPMSAGTSQTGAIRGGGTEFAIMTRSLFSSFAQLSKFSSAVIHVNIRKAFYSVLVEGVVGPVLGRSDRATVTARLGWTESEKQHLEAVLQGRQHETALFLLAPTLQGAEKRALHATGVRPVDPTAGIMFAFAFARFHRKAAQPAQEEGFVARDLAARAEGRFRRSVQERSTQRKTPYMDDFFLPVISNTAAELLRRLHSPRRLRW